MRYRRQTLPFEVGFVNSSFVVQEEERDYPVCVMLEGVLGQQAVIASVVSMDGTAAGIHAQKYVDINFVIHSVCFFLHVGI